MLSPADMLSSKYLVDGCLLLSIPSSLLSHSIHPRSILQFSPPRLLNTRPALSSYPSSCSTISLSFLLTSPLKLLPSLPLPLPSPPPFPLSTTKLPFPASSPHPPSVPPHIQLNHQHTSSRSPDSTPAPSPAPPNPPAPPGTSPSCTARTARTTCGSSVLRRCRCSPAPRGRSEAWGCRCGSKGKTRGM